MGAEENAERTWRAGSLHSGKLDIEGVLWTLARRLVPLETLKQKMDTYVAEGVIDTHDREKSHV